MARGRRGRLLLIDAHSLIYRAFFALPPMSTSSGEVTNAVYGFTAMLAIVLANRPQYAAAAFDLGGLTHRAAEYAEYKLGRRPMPDDLRPQIERVREVLEAFGIPIHTAEGYEADDVIGTLSSRAVEMDLAVTIVSGDLDCLQLVGESVDALVPRRGITETVTYGPDQVRQRYGLEPAQMIDYKALRGDSSDNIPGVPGVGEKTAIKLLQQFGSLEALLDRLDELPEGRLKANLQEHTESARLAKRMVTIVKDIDVPFDLERCHWTHYDASRVRDLFDRLEFRALLSRFPPPDVAPIQASLAFEPAAAPDGQTVVSDRAALGRLAAAVEDWPVTAVFAVWNGASRQAELVGLGLCGGAKEASIPPHLASPAEGGWIETFYIPLGHRTGDVCMPLDEVVAALRPHLAGAFLEGHDAKETELGLGALGLPPHQWSFDTFLAAYLLGAGSRDPRLDDLAREFLGLQVMGSEELLGSGRAARKVPDCAVAETANFVAERARAIHLLAPRLEAELKNLGVDYLFHEIELPLARVLAAMEREGVAVDVPYLEAVADELSEQLAAIEGEVAELVTHPVNLNAPAQLARLLFEELKLPTGKRIKTGYSTDAETLEGLRDKHPIIPRILDHRQLSKLKSTYVDALPALVDPTTGRIHTSFNQAATATGRLSSSNPNLMNIPIRTELGQRIRRAFVARGNQVLFGADYAQIELRIAAHLSEDPQLLAAFAAGQDIHQATAAKVFKVALEEVTPNQRRLAKVANFGSLYGQGEYGLSLQMGIPGAEAKAFLGEYWSTYARLKEFLDEVRRRAREDGVVVNANGRRRAIPDLRSPNFQLRQAAERMAINFPIQSLQADIIKIAMVRVAAEMEAVGLAGKMILQVHDELVFEIPERELDAFAEMVPRVMTGAYDLLTGIEVDAKSGPNWAEMTPLPVRLG